jgi:hypothetical protein
MPLLMWNCGLKYGLDCIQTEFGILFHLNRVSGSLELWMAFRWTFVPRKAAGPTISFRTQVFAIKWTSLQLQLLYRRESLCKPRQTYLTIWRNISYVELRLKLHTLVAETLCYKPECSGFESRRLHWFFFSICSLTMALMFTQPLTEMNTRKRN